jgi:hypothetical protein
MADYEFLGPFAKLKRHLSDFVQDAFLEAQDAESVLAWRLDTLKHCFTDFTKVVF